MEQNGFYSIVSSYSLRSNSVYMVAVSVHKSDNTCEIQLKIKGPSYENIKEIQVQPMTTENVDFDIPKIQAGDYELQAEGKKGILFQKTIPLHFQDNQPLVCIQLDKATYKPNDLIQFRLIFMDDGTSPAKIHKPLSLTISDAEKNRLKYWQNIELTKGIYKGQYQLSEQPILGKWRLDITLEGETLETKYFDVEKYVLPKYSVTVEAPKDVAILNGIINVNVRAQYTYGKSVKGKATVTVKPTNWYHAKEGEILQSEKTIEVNGKGQVQFKVGEDISVTPSYILTMEIKAVMVEDLTGNSIEAKTTVDLHEHRFHFDGVDLPYDFHPGVPLKLQIAVKNLDYSPVLNSKHPLKLIIEKQRHYYCDDDEEMETVEHQQENIVAELLGDLNEVGVATFEHTFPVDAPRYYYLQCEYLECRRYFTSLSKYEKPEQIEEVNEPLSVSVLTKEPKLNEELEFEVTSSDSIPYFIYTLHARGKHLKTEIVTLAEDTRSHIIKFRPTFDMIPYTSIFVHYIDGQDLRFEYTTINFEHEFKNSIEIAAPTETKPGENIVLKVKTEPDSYVGLLGVDQSVLLLQKGNDLDKYEIFHKLGIFDNSTASRSVAARCPGENAGLITLTNANYPVYDVPSIIMYSPGVPSLRGVDHAVECCEDNMGFEADDEITARAIKIRKEFPENWIFDDFENVTSAGLVLQKKVPDTITSWILTGFALNPKTGIALTKEPLAIKTFKPFFIGTNLPYAVKRGESVTIPALIFNYMDKDVEAQVTFNNTDSEFEFVEPGDDQLKRMKTVHVPANGGSSVNFIIRPLCIGYVMLKITAISPLAGDAVHKELKVEPEGITVFKNRDFYLNSEAANLSVNETVQLDIPENVTADSEFIEFTVMGNILGSTITNIDNLVRMPCGCGEQIMVHFVPNILVLWYLESIKELTPAIEQKAKRYLEIGYQRELTYKHDDGSYSAFGKSDSSGSTWLTAYVIRSFHQAKNYIDIDVELLEQGLEFLAKTQAPNGSFKEVGHVLDSTHLNEVGLTAFVLITFLENTEFSTKYEQTIERGFEYLQKNVSGKTDLYGLAIAMYALQQRKLEVLHEILAKLEALARIDGGLKWWTKKEKNIENDLHVSNHDVEITGYILMTLLDMNISVLPITRWLIAQRNGNGGYGSTQETVVGLWALIKFAEKNGATNTDMSITVTTAHSDITGKTFILNKENSLVLQSLQLPKQTREISFSSCGSGTAVLQISYHYNITVKETKPSFKLSTKVKPQTIPARLSLDVLVEYTPAETTKYCVSNMVVMEVSLPSGYTALTEFFDKVKQIENVKRIETKNCDTCIVIYFDALKISDVKSIPIEAELANEVADQKPTPITIYDYYENEKRATEFYEI